MFILETDCGRGLENSAVTAGMTKCSFGAVTGDLLTFQQSLPPRLSAQTYYIVWRCLQKLSLFSFESCL